MKIATYNINSIKARTGNFFSWLKETQPDLVFLQEIKCETENFLYFECESLGYKCAVLGQKSYNGVAILSKYDLQITATNLPEFQDDPASRYIEILVQNGKEKFYAASIYAPNGCSADKTVQQEKLAYKLKWFDKFYHRATELLYSGYPVIFGGDFNVMMQDIDVYDENRFKHSPLYIKEVQDKIRTLMFAGFHDTFRTLYPEKEGYTFWDYTGNAFVTNSGLRIDYLFISACFALRLKNCFVDKSLRMADKPSDHTALIAEFED
ncbi:MAG: exodeoxyribonuclease III [Alphaproteobacteria bacterium]|nr:exodeoxyribonuclease III [Alphaproteobacteria bacterium]